MGLDIYVGSLTRYYTGDWQTIVQQLGQQQGFQVMTVRPEDFTLAGRVRRFTERLLGRKPPGADAVRAAVTEWRSALSRELGADLRQGLDWDEAPEAPYFTDKPAWDGYWGVVLLAAYDEHPELPRPARVTLDRPNEDPALRASNAEGFRSRYRQLLDPGVELWLPCSFEFTFRAQDIGGRNIGIGSSMALLQQLRDLNGRTLRGSPEELAVWHRENAEHGAPFDATARFGLALLLHLAEQSVTHRLPMKLDY
jgi:hypothetical protein